MSDWLARLGIDLWANVAGLQSDLGRAQREADKFAKGFSSSMARMDSSIAKTARNITGGLIAALGVRELARFGKEVIDTADDLNDLSKQFGISTKALSAFGYAAQQNGSDLDKASSGFQKFAKNINDAAGGGEKAVKLFDAIGVSVTDAEGKVRPMEAVLDDVAKKFAGYESGASKAALAQELFGRSGRNLIPTLDEIGEKGFGTVIAAAEKLGVVVEQDLAEAADKFNDSMEDVSAGARGVANDFLREFLPAMTKSAQATAEFLGSDEFKGTLFAIAEGAQAAAKYVDDLAVVVGTRLALQAVPAAIAAVRTLATGIGTTAAASGGLTAALTLLGGPVGVLALAAGAAYYLSTQQTEVEKTADAAKEALDRLNNSSADNIDTSLRLAIAKRDEAKALLEAAKASLAAAEAAGAEAQARLQNTTSKGGVDMFAGQMMGAELAAQSARDDIATLKSTIADLDKGLAASVPKILDFSEGLNKAGKAGKNLPPIIDRNTKAANEAAEALTEWRRAQEQHDAEMLKAEAILIDQRRALTDLNAEHDETMRRLDEEARLLGLDERARRALEPVIEADRYARELLNRVIRDKLPLSEAEIALMREEYLAHLKSADAAKLHGDVAEDFRGAWVDSIEGVQRALSDLISTGLSDWKEFGRALEQNAENYLGNIADLFQRTVLTQGGGGTAAFTQGLNQNSMFGQGGTGSTVGGWMSAAGMAYSGWQAAGRGDRWGTVAQFTAAGTSIMPGWGTLIGAVVGLIVAFTRTVHDPEIRLAGSQGRIRNQEGQFQTVFGEVRAGSAAGVKWEQYVDGIRQFDKAIFEMVSQFDGAEPRLQAIRAALATWSVDLTNDAAQLENVLQSRFNTIVGTFELAIQSFVFGASDLKDQMERFGDALAAQAAFVAAGIDDIDFAQFLRIVDDMTMAGEDTGAAVSRIVGGMGLLGAALDVMDVDLEMAGEQFVRFATSITEAAGGLDQAQSLWDDYFRTFYTAEELAARSLENLTANRDSQLTALGLDPSITQAQFRQLFEEALPTLSADAVVQWLNAARAIGLVIDAEGHLNEIRSEEQRNAETLAALIEGLQFDDYLEGLSGADREIARIRRQFEGYIAQAIALGASEEELTELRRLEANAIDRVTEATQNSADAFEDYWATIAQIAADAAAQMLDDLHRAAEQVQSFLNGMALSSTSSLSPEQRIAEARRQFLQLVQLAGQGDTNAMSQLAQAAQLLLTEGRNFFGAGAEFTALEAMVRNLLQPFGAIAGSSDLQGAFALLTEAVHRLTAVLQRGTPATNGFTAGTVAASVFTPAGLAVATAGGGAGDSGAVVAELEYVGAKVDRLSERIDNAADQVSRALEQIAKHGGRGKSGWG